MRISVGRFGKPLQQPARRFYGVLFACLALLTQMVVGILPMPAQVQMPWPICSVDPAAKTSHAPHQTPVDSGGHCPVCLALHFAGNTLPPPDGAMVGLTIAAAGIVPAAILRRSPGNDEFRPHQARAPPAQHFIALTT